MKTAYFNYIICALCTAWVVSFGLGFSLGFASYIPIMALFGSVFLFAVAAPLLIYKTRLGVILGFIGCLFIIPFNFLFISGFFEDRVFSWVMILALLMLFSPLYGLFMALRLIAKKESDIVGFNSTSLRFILAFTPIVLLNLYLVFYGKYWSWSMFNIYR